MRFFTYNRIAGNNNMTFKIDAVAQSDIAGHATKWANSNISAKFYAIFNNRRFVNITHKGLLKPVS